MRDEAVRTGDQAYGAVVVKDGRIIGFGPSRVVLKKDVTAHAEREAIREAQARLGRRYLSGCLLYSSSRPCPACEAAAAQANIARMYFGAEATDAGAPRQIMIDHISIAVRDLDAGGRFYEAVLATLGYAKMIARPTTIGFGKKYPDFWINLRPDMTTPDPDGGVHICLRARKRASSRCVSRRGAQGGRRAPTVRRARGRNIRRATTRPSCSIRTATASRRSRSSTARR